MLNEFTELTPLRKTFVLLVAFVFLAAALHFILSGTYLPFDIRNGQQWGWDFRNNLWSPSYLLLHGHSPYRIDRLYDANTVWLPMVIGTFFPVGMLPLAIAKNVWFVLNIGIIALILALSIRQERPNPGLLAVCLIGLFIFPPLVSHILLGQFSLMTVLLCLLAAEMLARNYAPGWIALPVALALTKPQLALLVVPGLMAACYERGGWRGMVSFPVALMGWCLLMSLPLWVGYPAWPEGFRWAMERNATWLQPSTLQVLRTAFGSAGLLLWAMLAGAALVAVGWLWRHRSPRAAMCWTLALTVLVTPYVWTWDFVLMLPLLVFVLFNCPSRTARAVWIVGFAVGWLLMMQVRLGATSFQEVTDEQFWWVSWFLMGLILATLAANRLFPRPETQEDASER